LGHSEEIHGKAIGDEKEIIIVTKVGNVSMNDQFTVDYSKEYILDACEASLKRLKRDVIDYYQLHTARIAYLQNGECIEAMQQLQQQGKIRYWGISLNTFDPVPEAEFFIENNLPAEVTGAGGRGPAGGCRRSPKVFHRYLFASGRTYGSEPRRRRAGGRNALCF